MISIIYSLAVLAMLAFFSLVPRKKFRVPPHDNDDDEGGEPINDGLPDLDLPPGICLPINDWEPDYNRKHIRESI